MKPLSALLSVLLVSALPSFAAETFYVGTYTAPNKSQGIYRYEFDETTGKLTEKGLAAESANPSFLALHPSGKYVYSCNESGTGFATAFAIEADGKLKELSKHPANGGGTTHISLDPAGKNALVANYNTGSVAVFPIQADGSIAEATGFMQHKGSGPDASRQKGPHAHSIYVDASGHHVYACDLGLDKIFLYELDPATGKLSVGEPPFTQISKPGGGPRHAVFGAGEKFLYCVEEMSNDVVAYAHDATTGALKEVQRLSALPAGFTGKSSTAEVAVHPNGKFAYVSNRGDDSIAQFSIDAASGKLTLIGHTPCGGKSPRHFAIDPSGKWLLTANQSSNSIAVLKLDLETGKLTPTENSNTQLQAVCILFVGSGK